MAKKKASIEVEVKDKGTFKKVAMESKKAGDGINSVSKNSKDAEKNVKGVAGTASAAGKQFAGMSRGMGGLVGAYAALAAEIFAITAAFNFLKAAGDLRVLEQGQNAYAASTGLAMRTLANDIVAATNAQINFKDAAQAAAIGTAAGLNAEQLERLGQAAKVTSQALGRDVTDSFNRLVRGVTKAEPELLDELGIILRLEEASQRYAEALNLNANSLTTFQKSQAVLNEVLRQSEEKFKILYDNPIDANPYQQLGKAFNDVLLQVQKLTDFIARPLAKVLTETPILAIAGFSLLLTGPLKALGFSFKEMAINASEAAQVSRQRADETRAAYERLNVAINSSRSSLKALAKEQAAGTGSAALKGLIGGRDLSNKELGKLKSDLDRATKTMSKNGQIVRGVFTGMSVDVARNFSRMINSILVDSDQLVSRTEVNFARVKSAGSSAVAGIRKFGAGVASIATRLLNIIGMVGLFYTVFSTLVAFLDKTPKVIDKNEERLKKLQDRVKELNEQYKEFLATQHALLEVSGAVAGGQVLGSLGNVSGSVNAQELQTLISLRTKYLGVQEQIDELDKRLQFNVTKDVNARAALENQRRNLQSKITKEGTEAVKFIDRQIEAVNLLKEEFGVTSKAADAYIQALKSGENVEEAKRNFEFITASLRETSRAAPEAEQAFTQFLNSFAGVGQKTQQINLLDEQIRNLAVTAADTTGLPALADKIQIGILVRRKEFMEAVRDLEFETNKAAIIRQRTQQESLRNLDSVQTRITAAKNEQATTEDLIEEKKKRIKLQDQGIQKLAENQRTEAQQKLKILEEELKVLQAQKVELDDTVDLVVNSAMMQYRKEFLSLTTQELNTTRQLLDILSKENTIRADNLKLEEDTASLRLASLQREQDKGMFSGVGRDQRLAEQAVELQESLVTKRKIAIENEFSLRKEMVDLEYDLLQVKLVTQANDLRILAEEAKNKDNPVDKARGARLERLADSLEGRAGNLGTVKSQALSLIDQQESFALEKLADDLDKVKDAKFALEDIQVLSQAVGDSIAQNMTSAFSSIIQGTSSVKDAFKNMAVNILNSIAQVLAQMLAMRLIMSFIPGFAAPVPSVGMTDTVNPAMFAQTSMTARYGGMFKGYGDGGIARGKQAGYPAILHGTEAVVPLPNGNKIPVEMVNGSGAQNNNVTVNVAIDGQGRASSNTQQDSAQAGNLGNIIAKAVQQELQNQKRSGGILNPYGVA